MSANLDPRALRDAFSAFTTGVTVVTAMAPDGAPLGFTANSFSSVSLDPALLLVCLARTSRNFDSITRGTGFAVNILAEDQREISNTFARPVADRFAAVSWRPGPAGSPILDGTAAWFDCRMHQIVEAGDHAILVGRIVGFANSGRNGLGYARGSYFTPALAARASHAASAEETLVAAVAERDGAVLLVPAEAGRFGLPQIRLGAGEPTEVLARHLTAVTRLPASVGFLFSVFEDRATARQHIVYRAGLGLGEPQGGRMFPLSALPVDRLDSAQTADILRRFAAESMIGDFGVYFGNETAGRVHPLARKA